MLRDHTWEPGYDPDGGDLLKTFYSVALQDAKFYFRSTGYFTANSLTLISRGIEALIKNQGTMRVLVGCTLEADEIKAIEKGEDLQQRVAKRLLPKPLEPLNPPMRDALELLAWMVANQFLEIKVVVPFNSSGQPIATHTSMFHTKNGLIEDRAGNRIAWNGSLNESEAGWQRNWENITVFTEWEHKHHFDAVANALDRMWNGSRKGHGFNWMSFTIPEALKRDLLQYLPRDKNLPKRLKRNLSAHVKSQKEYWDQIEIAPTLPNGGERVGEATASVVPWQHQIRTFLRLYRNWPPRELIADEVGLGKTIQAGLLLRQAILAKKANRNLILVPKAVERQWQIELHEKFNLNVPIFHQGMLSWYAPRFPDLKTEQRVSKPFPQDQQTILMSSQLARRENWATILLEQPPWDLVILDEAHHARRRPSRREHEDRPNALLRLMRSLQTRTSGLVLLTATPMQVDPLEVWDLLNLLGLPKEWSAARFQDFFVPTNETRPFDLLKGNTDLFQACEEYFGNMDIEFVKRVTSLSGIGGRKVLKALRERKAVIPLNLLSQNERSAGLELIKIWSPIRHRISRHTRRVLRNYIKRGILKENVAERHVVDRFVEMSEEERRVYHAVERYIETTFKRAEQNERNAVGFVMTVYRKRVASSFHALRMTLDRRFQELLTNSKKYEDVEDDLNDDELLDDIQTNEDIEKLQNQALLVEELNEIKQLVQTASGLPTDSKLNVLLNVIEELRDDGYDQVMVFTQYTDTMDFIRTQLFKLGMTQLLCYSGRGGEIPDEDSSWRALNREEAKKKFQTGNIQIFLCTEAASEGLNFQFCGALVNYDMPWNPMRVEQRIGRIDRVGQKFEKIKIVNLHYENTVETDVYRVLRERINIFQDVVGPLQPILAKLPGEIQNAVLTGQRKPIDDLPVRIEETRNKSFDLDTFAGQNMEGMPSLTESPLDFTYLRKALENDSLLPDEVNVNQTSQQEFHVIVGDHQAVRVTTNRTYFDRHSENVELWSPGGTTFELVRALVNKESRV